MDNKLKEQAKLPAVRFALFWAVGLLASFYGGTLLRAAVLSIGAAAGIIFLLKKNPLAICAAGLFFGAAAMLWQMCFIYAPADELCGQTVEADFVVTEILSTKGDRAEYLAKLDCNGTRINVRLYGEDKVRAGDKCRAEVTFKKSEDSYRVINRSKGIAISGSVGEIISQESGFSLAGSIAEIRTRCMSIVRRYISGEEGALALAMMFGEEGTMSLRLSEAFKVSGVAHFTAVSGTHFAVLFMVLLELLADDKKLVRALLSLVLIPLAVMFFGATASVVRSAVMILILNCSPLILRRGDTLNSLSIALLALTAANPSAVLDAGLQMSVLGVFGAAIIGRGLGETLSAKLPHRVRFLSAAVKALCCSACAVVFTSPVAIACFGGVSLIGAISSLIVMPLFTLGMVFVLLLVITGAQFFALPAAVLLRVMIWIISALGKWRGLWLCTDYKYAAVIAALCALCLFAAVYEPAEMQRLGLRTFVALSAFSLVMCLVSRGGRGRISFVSDGKDGAAVISMGSESAVYIAGGGGNLAPKIAEALRRNGAMSIRFIAADGLDHNGALSVSELTEIVPTGAVYANENVRGVLFRNSDCMIADYSPNGLSIGNITVSCAKAGDSEVCADIVMYTGYKLSEPANAADTALYCSSRQNILPENGVNIYDTEYCIDIGKAKEITINGKE